MYSRFLLLCTHKSRDTDSLPAFRPIQGCSCSAFGWMVPVYAFRWLQLGLAVEDSLSSVEFCLTPLAEVPEGSWKASITSSLSTDGVLCFLVPFTAPQCQETGHCWAFVVILVSNINKYLVSILIFHFTNSKRSKHKMLTYLSEFQHLFEGAEKLSINL